MTAGLYFLKYGSALTWRSGRRAGRCRPSVRASVNGTVNTVGSVPAASLAANVGPVHWYSTDLTLIDGLAFSNSLTWLLNCWVASFVLPGISDATLIVTVFAELFAAVEIELDAHGQQARRSDGGDRGHTGGLHRPTPS